ncbi:chemotaxis protein CheA [Psychromarinibacter sp. C21-152]|uniref:Chemotaxis protein CheA n=1 Tax=Psychromarinibacter sediminicola TaxID=3033385 RepID=A0AAE3T8H4_9RHOB|nr:chemotaxis protein CheA [Psychromarinibacter sediminicola]MDF0600069.1 chemotaxis protein CheA [Psychromarinibacter sediminicola]
MSKTDELRTTFFQEAEDLLEQLTDGLEELSCGDADPETVNSVFRAVHSIKGGAGAFALEAIVRFAHRFENVLDALRSGELAMSGAVLDVLMRSSDHLTVLLETARDGTLEEDDPAGEPLLAELMGLTGATESPADSTDEVDFTPMTMALDDLSGPGPSELRFHIGFRPHDALFRSGNEPVFLLRDVCALGEAEVQCDLSGLPDFDSLDTEASYLAWQIALQTEASDSAVHEVFEFVDGLCDLTVDQDGVEPLPDLPSLDPPSGPGADPEESAPTPEPAAAAYPPPAAATAASPAAASPEAARASGAARPEAAGKSAPPQPVASTIRVDLHRIDRMINLVGELVINQAMLTQAVKRDGIAQGSDADVGLEELRTLTRQIQDSVMAIRAQPVKALFQRMSRIAREAGSETGKTLRMVTEGAATEIDKTVIEKLADPLTHMIRNAVDHGLENAEDRIAAGKTPEGSIRLSAAHLSGRVVIEISDDGAGINRDKVREIAEEKGLIAPDAQLTPNDVDNLIFQPGFSTANELTALSGRGVGMDVVKKSIQSLGGRVSISSEPGDGSTFSIVLPLTLAVLDGMVIEVGGQTVVIPISAILETMRVPTEQVFQLGTNNAVVRLRGAYVPIVDVGAVMGYRAPVAPDGEHVILLVETADGVRAALLIDAIHDQRQVVIKGLEENYGQVPGVAAATILGDGRIALILDPSAIVGHTGAGGGAALSTPLAAE